MIKRGDKGTLDKLQARVIADDIAGEFPLAIEVIYEDGSPGIYLRSADGTTASKWSSAFIPSRPWDSLKPGDACFVRDRNNQEWSVRVFAGVMCGRPTIFTVDEDVPYNYCVPAKLIDGELVPVEEE